MPPNIDSNREQQWSPGTTQNTHYFRFAFGFAARSDRARTLAGRLHWHVLGFGVSSYACSALLLVLQSTSHPPYAHCAPHINHVIYQWPSNYHFIVSTNDSYLQVFMSVVFEASQSEVVKVGHNGVTAPSFRPVAAGQQSASIVPIVARTGTCLDIVLLTPVVSQASCCLEALTPTAHCDVRVTRCYHYYRLAGCLPMYNPKRQSFSTSMSTVKYSNTSQ